MNAFITGIDFITLAVMWERHFAVNYDRRSAVMWTRTRH